VPRHEFMALGTRARRSIGEHVTGRERRLLTCTLRRSLRACQRAADWEQAVTELPAGNWN
jgi:hypothetical protein